MRVRDWRRALPVVAILTSGNREVPVRNDVEGPEETSTIAARVAVLALAASASRGWEAVRAQWLWLPDGGTLGTDELIAKLALQGKPVECEATRLGSAISVMCITITDERRLRSLRAMNSKRRRLNDRYQSNEEDVTILVRVGRESFVASGKAIDAFLDDYFLGHSNVGFTRADVEAQALGAVAVLTVTPTIGPTDSDSIEPDTAPKPPH